MSPTHSWADQHPIKDDVFNVAYSQHCTDNREKEFYHERLATVQRFLEGEKLRTYLAMGRPDQHPAIEVVDASDNGYAFVDYQEARWESIFDALGIYDDDVQALIEDCHRKQIVMTRAELSGAPDDVEWLDDDTWDGIIVGASKVWRDAQQSAQDYLKFLVSDAGCSPAEALDYFMCERNEMEQTLWAYWRGVDQSAVNKNVASALEKIDENVIGAWEEPDISEEQEQARKEAYEQMEEEIDQEEVRRKYVDNYEPKEDSE